ncbi:MAG: glycosyltransferase family 4 protein [Myxococcales bacterium]|nr:glycosyltransferase family 4 protein [Myxococcales bacterium]
MIHLLCPGSLEQRTGGYLYDARLVQGLRDRGHAVQVHDVQGSTVPELSPRGRVIVDGLGWPDIADVLEQPALVIVHSPLWREAADPTASRAAEERALQRAARVVCTSHRTASDLSITRPCTVIEPGTDAAPLAFGGGGGRLLCAATVTPRKAHDVLLRALASVPGEWQLRCAGSRTRDRTWAAQVTDLCDRLGLTDRVHWLGELGSDALAAEYATADVLVHAAHYEGWGMSLAEALVRGLPVVSTPAGLFDTRSPEAWVRVEPGDPAALAEALAAILADPERRAHLRREALALGLPDWPDQVARYEHELAQMETP